MGEIVDITGTIYNGMWGLKPPFPEFNMRPLPDVPWVKNKVYCEIFDGLHSQTGTYLETPAHVLGDKSYPLIDVDLSRLVDIETVIIKLDGFSIGAKRPITVQMLESNPASSLICDKNAVLICCNWGRYWYDEKYLKCSPYFTKEAMQWLINKRPYLLGSDFPQWDNVDDSQGFFEDFYENNILMLAPCVNLEKASSPEVLLTALPIKIERTSCTPCRAFIRNKI
jgi:kynurenine formamidase